VDSRADPSHASSTRPSEPADATSGPEDIAELVADAAPAPCRGCRASGCAAAAPAVPVPQPDRAVSEERPCAAAPPHINRMVDILF